MIRSALICHRGDSLNEDGIARWLTSFSDLRLIVRIDDPPGRFWKRIRSEKKRSGLTGLLDALAFRIWFYLFRSGDESRWEAAKLDEMRRLYPEVPETCRILDVDSPNADEVAEALQKEGVDFALARCKRILTRRIFSLPTHGVFVIHPGICPDYRNAHGCFWALVRDDDENVGATLLQVDAGIDTGPVLGYFRVPHDPLRESHIRIQNRVVLENLDTIADHILRRTSDALRPFDTSARPSGAWGQPRLTTFLRWRHRRLSRPDR